MITIAHDQEAKQSLFMAHQAITGTVTHEHSQDKVKHYIGRMLRAECDLLWLGEAKRPAGQGGDTDFSFSARVLDGRSCDSRWTQWGVATTLS